MHRPLTPVRFDPVQEMHTTRTLELRYTLDEESPHVEFHAHPFYEIYFFLEGPMERYVIGGRSYQLKAGDILMIPPTIMHHPIFTEDSRPYKRYVLWLSLEHMEQLENLDPDLLNVLRMCQEQEEYRIRCATSALAQQLEGYLRSMWQENQGNAPCKYASFYSQCTNFLVALNRIVTDNNIIPNRYDHQSSLMDRLLGYIHDNYANPISLSSVAEHFFVSPSTVEQLFSKKLGKPFYRYVTECRIIHAQTLIISGMPLKSVGQACGYNDYSNFYKAFTREVGVSPSEFKMHLPPDHFQATLIKEGKISPEKG